MRKMIGIVIVMLLIVTSFSVVGTFNYSYKEKIPSEKIFNDEWKQNFGGNGVNNGNCVQQTSDNGYILVIETSKFSDGDFDIWVIKTDENGNIVWDTKFGGSENDYPLYVEQTIDDGYIIVGITASYSVEGDWDAWLIKTDSNGNEQWNRTYGGAENDFGYTGFEITDGYVIEGGSKSFGKEEGYDYWLIKTDTEGNEIWNKTYGGSAKEEGRRMRKTSDNGYIISGFIWPTELFQKGCCYLVKIDDDGNLEWEKYIYYGNRHGLLRTIQQTNDGGYILAGEANVISLFGMVYLGGGDIWLVKTDRKGNIEWDKTIGSIFLEDGAFDIDITDDDGYLIAGYTKGIGGVVKQSPVEPPLSTAWLVKTDANGNIEWDKEVSQGICYYCSTTNDGGCIVTGGERPHADGDAFLVKID
jgi:hypothetical protein